MSFTDLPVYVGEKKSFKKCKTACDCKTDEKSSVDSKIEIDRRLLNWQKWVQMRKNVHKILGEALERHPGDLLMNAYEDYRSTREEKQVFEYTNISLTPDPARGCPSFWMAPYSLPDKYNYKLPTLYRALMPKEQQCKVPEIAYTKVPNIIKEAKGVFPKRREGYKNWCNIGYRQERLVKLAEEISLIEPHKPQLDELVLKGTSLSLQSSTQDIHIPLQVMEAKQEEIQLEDIKQKICFIINYVPIFEKQEGTIRPRIIFDYDINRNRVLKKFIKMENTTDMVLRYYFKTSPKPGLFRDMIKESPLCEQVFYFNKNEHIILPGEMFFFPFFFKTNHSGTYIEYWDLKFTPNIFPKLEIVLLLQAFADHSKKEEKLDELKDRISNNARKALIDKSLQKFQKVSFESIVYMYNKKKIFEAVNSHFDPYNKQNKYVYNKDIVDELEKLYEKIKLPSHPDVWNLKLLDLRVMAKERDVVEEELSKVKMAERYYKQEDLEIEEKEKNILKECFKKTTCESTNETRVPSVELKKEENVDDEIMEIIKKEKKYSAQLELLIEKLEQPILELNLEQEKYEYVYSILSVHFDCLCEEIETLRERLNVIHKITYPDIPNTIADTPRFVIEENKHKYRKCLNDVRFYPTKGETQRPDYLKDIPFEDYTKRYKLYYGLPDEEEVGDKKKKGGKKDKKIEKLDKAKSVKTEKSNVASKIGKSEKSTSNVKMSQSEDLYKIDTFFYPFGTFSSIENFEHLEGGQNINEDFDDTAVEVDSSSLEEVPVSIMYQYKYNLFLLFYKTLENIISAVTEYLDSIQTKLSLHRIKEIEECRSCGMHYKHKKIHNLNLIDLRNIISMHDLKKNYFVEEQDTYEIEIKPSLPEYATESHDQVSSLFSILQPYRSKPEISKSISYPEKKTRIETSEYRKRPPAMFDVYTETSDEIVNPDWLYYKTVGLQTDVDQSPSGLKLSSKEGSADQGSEFAESYACPGCDHEEEEIGPLEEECPVNLQAEKKKKKKQTYLKPNEAIGYFPEYSSEEPVFYNVDNFDDDD